MKLSQNKTEYRKLSELKKLSNNPRQIKNEQFDKLLKSIKDNPGYFESRPIILSDRTGELIIIAGNQRYEAAKKLKLKTVPTFLLSGLTEEKEHEITIRDNVSNGSWDWDLLANNFDELKLIEWGVEIPNFDNLDFDNVKSNENREAPNKDNTVTCPKCGEIINF